MTGLLMALLMSGEGERSRTHGTYVQYINRGDCEGVHIPKHDTYCSCVDVRGRSKPTSGVLSTRRRLEFSSELCVVVRVLTCGSVPRCPHQGVSELFDYHFSLETPLGCLRGSHHCSSTRTECLFWSKCCSQKQSIFLSA